MSDRYERDDEQLATAIRKAAATIVVAIEDLRDTIVAQFKQHDNDLRAEVVGMRELVRQFIDNLKE